MIYMYSLNICVYMRLSCHVRALLKSSIYIHVYIYTYICILHCHVRALQNSTYAYVRALFQQGRGLFVSLWLNELCYTLTHQSHQSPAKQGLTYWKRGNYVYTGLFSWALCIYRALFQYVEVSLSICGSFALLLGFCVYLKGLLLCLCVSKRDRMR